MKFKSVFVIVYFSLRGSAASDWTFPEDFKFGVATSAYQIEGGWDADGKGASVWDYLTHTNPNFVLDQSSGDVACDSYNKWKEDVQMLKNLGVNYYRFSLSWTRLYPNGFATNMNQAGIDYYNNLINELLDNGIEPVITLLHFDAPRTFSALGSFYSSSFINLFAQYSRLAFASFGDRVKTWITINEPYVVCVNYNEYMGLINDYYPTGLIEYLCSHTFIKSHAEAYHIYKTEFKHQEGEIGIALNFEWSEPGSDSPEDVAAAEQRRQFEFGLYANPIVFGTYPKIVIDRVAERSKLENFPESRLPKLTFYESMRLKGTYDFIGLNQYSGWLVEQAEEQPIGAPSFQNDMGTSRYVDPAWEDNEWDGKVVPWALRNSLKWLKETYNDPTILITECGYPDRTGILEDDRRISYLQKHLNATLEAIHEDNVKVKTFTVWSLMDNFEWTSGYTIKFGLYQVDFSSPNRTRTPKKSAEYFQKVVESRTV